MGQSESTGVCFPSSRYALIFPEVGKYFQNSTGAGEESVPSKYAPAGRRIVSDIRRGNPAKALYTYQDHIRESDVFLSPLKFDKSVKKRGQIIQMSENWLVVAIMCGEFGFILNVLEIWHNSTALNWALRNPLEPWGQDRAYTFNEWIALYFAMNAEYIKRTRHINAEEKEAVLIKIAELYTQRTGGQEFVNDWMRQVILDAGLYEEFAPIDEQIFRAMRRVMANQLGRGDVGELVKRYLFKGRRKTKHK